MKTVRWLLVAFLLAGCSAVAQGHHRDPMTQQEIEKVRDSSWEPKQRLPLYVQFARDRLVKLEQVRSDPKVTDRAKQTRDVLDDFQSLYDELNDNVDTYADRKNDIRKSLKSVIEADNEFQAKLRALKDAANTSPEQAKPYEFLLSNALDAVDSSVGDHRQLLTEQEDLAKHKKLVKPDTIQAN
jgi:uncharacterized coiled-coil DUF342 family protein